jgi:hypothetical protein
MAGKCAPTTEATGGPGQKRIITGTLDLSTCNTSERCATDKKRCYVVVAGMREGCVLWVYYCRNDFLKT